MVKADNVQEVEFWTMQNPDEAMPGHNESAAVILVRQINDLILKWS